MSESSGTFRKSIWCERINAALVSDVALPIAVNANRHELIAGESFTVDVSFPDKSGVPLKWTVDPSNLEVPAGWTVTLAEAKPGSNNNSYHFNIAIPAGAKAPSSPGDVILPWAPPLAKLALRVAVNDYTFTIGKQVDYSETKTTGIETYPLELIPAVTLTVEPQHAMVPVKHCVGSGEAAGADSISRHADRKSFGGARRSLGLEDAAHCAPGFFGRGRSTGSVRGDTSGTRSHPGAYPLHPYAHMGDEGVPHVDRAHTDNAIARLERAGRCER